jgi:vesicle-associated membrane protein 4
MDQTSSLNVFYIFIGNTSTQKHIAELNFIKSRTPPTETQKIFEKLSSIDQKTDQRNKIQSKDSTFYFTIGGDKSFYFVEASPNFAERDVFEMIDQIVKDNISTMTNDKGELNLFGKDQLKKVIDRYQHAKNNVQSITADVNDIKVDIKNAINKQTSNMEDLNSLDEKSRTIKLGAEVYKKDAKELERLTWWKNCKLTLLIILVIALLVVIVVVPAVVTTSKATGSTGTSTNTQTQTQPPAAQKQPGTI